MRELRPRVEAPTHHSPTTDHVVNTEAHVEREHRRPKGAHHLPIALAMTLMVFPLPCSLTAAVCVLEQLRSPRDTNLLRLVATWCRQLFVWDVVADLIVKS